MASSSSSVGGSNSHPFEWLSGGLFGKTTSGSGRFRNIESSTDVAVLLDGIEEDLSKAIRAQDEKMSDQKPRSTTEKVGGSEQNVEEEVDLYADLAVRLSRLKVLCYNERQTQLGSSPPPVASVMVHGLTIKHPTLIPRLISNMHSLPFESRKDVSSIFNYLLVCGYDGMDAPLYMSTMIAYANYVAQKYSQIMMPIIQGHDCGKGHSSTPDVALHCGTMLRSTLRHAVLYQMLVSPEYAAQCVYPFLDTFAHLPNFEVASDALETLRQILTGGISAADGMDPNDPVAAEISGMASDFLARSYVELIEERFNGKMLSEKANYINRRVALQLLSTILLSRTNYEIMIRYISSRQNLVLIMCLLRDSSPHITLDAFHVFKIFVANPNKPDDVIKILVNNKVKLCNYLETLHKEREANDDQFRDEKALVIATLHEL
eukprot:scaffold67100_cov51-Attheya_sp.AAC.3